MKIFFKISFCILMMALFSCEKIEKEPETVNPPTISLDREDASYTVKVAKELVIKPVYTNAKDAEFAWAMIGGETISTDSLLVYNSEEVGEKFLSLTVKNDGGEAYQEFKISVTPLQIPKVSLNVPEGGFTIVKGAELSLKPVLDNEDGITYKWTINEEEVAQTKDFTFAEEDLGKYSLQFTATSEDASTSVELSVNVVNIEDVPFKWTFEQTEYHLSAGRRIRIKIWDVKNAVEPEYIWTVNGVEKARGEAAEYIFEENEQGVYNVRVTMISAAVQISQDLVVEVCAPEGTYKRVGGSNSYCNKVFSYIPAPGQFINEDPAPADSAAANLFAMNRFEEEGYVSLGGFGGYVVVGFDHSIENDGDYNIQILGNSFEGSSEPGVVWVMQDENNDKEPNDTWYELKGSEYGKAEEKRDYSVTYFMPSAAGMPVQWEDSDGLTGEVDYLAQFHPQDFYYPLWVGGTSYTLRGTCLKSRTTQNEDSGFWVNGEYDWGYSDNFSPIDRLTNDENVGAATNANHFKISNAVTFDGKSANLKYVDFVKVVTGVNSKAGWLGEVSPEVYHVRDYNMIKNK